MTAQQPHGHGKHDEAAGDDQDDTDTREAQAGRHQPRSGLEQVQHADRDEHGAEGIEQQQPPWNALAVKLNGLLQERRARKCAATQLDQAAIVIDGGPPGAAGSAAASTTNSPG